MTTKVDDIDFPNGNNSSDPKSVKVTIAEGEKTASAMAMIADDGIGEDRELLASNRIENFSAPEKWQ